MAWWDHEELKSPNDRSDRYIVTFPREYTSKQVEDARARMAAEENPLLEAPRCVACNGTGQPRGVMGGPEHGLCSRCMGTGVEPRARSAREEKPAVDWKPDHVTDRSYMSGRVTRYSVWPTIAAPNVAEHTWGVYHVYWRIFGVPSAQLGLYIHLHDIEELVGGDNPFPSKMMFPKLKEATTEVEAFARKRLNTPEVEVTERERHRVKVCDLVEMMLFGMVEREMGNLLATPIVERTGDTARWIARENLPMEEYDLVQGFVAKERTRHEEVIRKQGSTY